MLHLPFPRLCSCGQVHRPPIRSAHDVRPFDGLYLSSTAKDLMLESMDESQTTGMKFGSIHTAYSTVGANEVAGGAPAYARKALTWGAAAAGVKALVATLPTFDIPPSTIVAWLGMWDALTSGNFLGMLPLGASAMTPFSVEAGDLAGHTIGSHNHGLTTDNRVVFWGGAISSGLAVGTIYWVIATGLTGDVFEVAASQGGSSIAPTTVGGGFVQKCIPEFFAGQGQYALNSASMDLGAVA